MRKLVTVSMVIQKISENNLLKDGVMLAILFCFLVNLQQNLASMDGLFINQRQMYALRYIKDHALITSLVSLHLELWLQKLLFYGTKAK